MHLVCPTQPLARAAKAVARMQQGKNNPGPEDVLLLATPASDGTPGSLTVLGWKPHQRAGLFATLPAQVERPGQVSVSVSRLAGYLATVRAETLTLTQETRSDQEPLPTPTKPETGATASEAEITEPEAAPPLTMTCAWTSALGHEVRRQAHFLACAPAEPGELPLAQWRSAARSVAILAAQAFRTALAICTPLAQSREAKEPSSDLFGVLVRFDAQGLLFTATTKWDLASRRVAVPLAPLFAQPCHALFLGADLVWLGKLLRDEEQIHLRLFREGEQAVLLVETAEETLFCAGRTTTLPTHWEQMPQKPASGRLVVEREAFTQAIARLAKATRANETEYVELTCTAHLLCLRLLRAQDDPEQMQTDLALTSLTSPLPTLLLDLGRVCQLVRKLQGRDLALEWGSFVQQLKDKRQVVGFLRLVCEALGTTLVMARSDVPAEEPASAQPSEAPVTRVDASPAQPLEARASRVTPPPGDESSDPSPEEPQVTTPPVGEAPAEVPVEMPPTVSPRPLAVAPVSRKEPFAMSFTLPSQLAGLPADEALSQLAWYYHRQFLQPSLPSASRDACAWIRDQLLSASSQQAAWEQIEAHIRRDWSEPNAPFWIPLCSQAAKLVRQVMDADGSIQPLVVGITDGFRHFCLRCGQDAEKREAIRFFQERNRRWLLAPEVGMAPRAVYERCQSCLQPLAPTQVVVFVPAGTVKHLPGCTCQRCNQRALAFVLNIYACDPHTQQILLPRISQVAAASRPQCVERAVALCWRQGWYMRSEDPRAHAQSPLALAPLPEDDESPVDEPIA